MPYPTWDKMTDQQKFDFLHDWCNNLSTANTRLSNAVQGLHERLQEVEKREKERGDNH